MCKIVFNPIRLVLLDELCASLFRDTELLTGLVGDQFTESLILDPVGVDKQVG